MDLFKGCASNYQAVLRNNLPDPKGPLTTSTPQQPNAETSKQVHTAALTKAQKKRGNSRFNEKMSLGQEGKNSCEKE